MNSLSPLRCPHGCKPVKQGFKLVRRYGPHYTPFYECLRCGQQFSGRYDSVFSGFHTDEQTIYRVLKALSEGIGIRAAARIFDLDKNTVVLILERAAEHCKRVSEQLIKNYHMDECQLDELWSFVKKRKHVSQHLRNWQPSMAINGVWIGFDPRHKVVIYFVVGRHIQANANKLLAGIRDRSDGHAPFFTSDELKHYDAAIMHAYGIKKEFPRTGRLGRPRQPILLAPKNLLYAQVVKHRKRGHIVDISTRIVFGTKKAVKAKLKQSPVSRHINTSFVERNNLTMRHHNRRLVRKTISFSKKRERLEKQLYLAFAYYHFVK